MSLKSNNPDVEQLSFLTICESPVEKECDVSPGNRIMHCLWNGEYGDHDLGHINGLDWMLENQRRIYEQYIGVVIGDFECIAVEYDWGRRDQRWTVRCQLCGEETYRYHTSDWRRGKGSKTICHCRRDAEIAAADERREERKRSVAEETGKIYWKYEVIEYKGYDVCRVRCKECGAVRRKGVSISNLRNGIYPECDCGKPKYGDEKWIGAKVGHLSVVRHEGHNFVCRCDCGRERVVTDSLFAVKRYRDCGNQGCEFIVAPRQKAIAAKLRGNAYEGIAEALIISGGYKTKRVGKIGDYGVDIIAVDPDGNEIAVQCKSNMNKTAGVSAVQEAYAGGRYYGLERFAVISHSGYSANAVRMARTLGVYLCDGTSFEYPEDIAKYAKELIPTVDSQKNVKAQKLYELNGQKKTLVNWAFEYGTSVDTIKRGMKKGLSFENALKYNGSKRNKYTVRDVSGSLAKLCEHFGIVNYPCALYRIHNGWDPETAVLTPKSENIGRPTKKPDKSDDIAI